LDTTSVDAFIHHTHSFHVRGCIGIVWSCRHPDQISIRGGIYTDHHLDALWLGRHSDIVVLSGRLDLRTTLQEIREVGHSQLGGALIIKPPAELLIKLVIVSECSRHEWPCNKTFRRLVADHDVLAWIDAMKAAQGIVSCGPPLSIGS
jgi:hypothetical protein